MAAFNEKTTYQLRKEGSSVCISPKPTHHNENDVELNQKNDQAFTKDGGYSWAILASGFLIYFVTFGGFNTLGVFQAYYLKVMFVHDDASKIAWIGTTTSTCSLFFGIIAGPIMRYIGIKRTVLVGMILSVLGYMLASFSTEIWQLALTMGAITGIGAALEANCAITAVSLWFNKKRSLAMNLMFMGGSIGGVIMVPIASASIRNIGFSWTARILGFINIFGGGIAYLLMKGPPGFKPTKKIVDIKMISDKYLLLNLGIAICTQAGFTTINMYFPSSLLDLGVSPSIAYNMAMIICGFLTICRIIYGLITDRVGPVNIMIFTSLAITIATMTLWYLSSSVVTGVIYAAFAGCFSTAPFGLIPILLANNYKPDKLPQVNGLVYISYGIANLCVGPLLGLVFDKIGHKRSYSALIIIAGCAYALCTIITVTLRIYSRRNIPKYKSGPI